MTLAILLLLLGGLFGVVTLVLAGLAYSYRFRWQEAAMAHKSSLETARNALSAQRQAEERLRSMTAMVDALGKNTPIAVFQEGQVEALGERLGHYLTKYYFPKLNGDK